jgi:lysine 2,3-aminomutase
MERWQEELANRITTIDQLAAKINLNEQEIEDLKKLNGKFKMSITPYYLSLADKEDRNCPIRKQAIPVIDELNIRSEELEDPLGDDVRSPIKGITHRYPDRVLLYPTYNCAMYCRHCFRRRIVSQTDKTLTPQEMTRAIEYIEEHPEIKEVILTGGDPLLLSDQQLEDLLGKIKAIDHVKWIRIHTRVYVTLPYRITPNLIKILASVRPLVIVTHVNHAKEITPEFKEAVDKTLKAGIMLLDQSVLLKGINDNVESLKNLFYGLLEAGVKPYYLHQCDLAQGISHFRTTVETGIKLLRQLRGFITGIGLPVYIIDTPGGYGKVPVDYNYIKEYKDKIVKLETFKGDIREYREP